MPNLDPGYRCEIAIFVGFFVRVEFVGCLVYILLRDCIISMRWFGGDLYFIEHLSRKGDKSN